MQHISHIMFPDIQSRAGGKYFEPVPAGRAEAIEPEDNGTFILPMKQSFMKNRRIMDSTARMLSMLAGWGGQGRALETTQGIIARHIGKSVRTVQRMLNDAWREGYLTYAYTKNRMGMITGIKIFLRLERLLKEKKPVKRNQNKSQNGRKPATTLMADTNRNLYINNRKIEQNRALSDQSHKDIRERLGRFARTAGFKLPD